MGSLKFGVEWKKYIFVKGYMKINNELFSMEVERTKTFLVGRIV